MASPAELHGAHAVLARTATTDDARARHLAGATEGRDETVAAALEAAAANARRRGATLDAASLYERANQLTPAEMPDDVIRRAMLGAECLFVDVSEIVQADAILERAIAAAQPGTARALAVSLRAIVRYYHGQTPDAIALGERALAEVGEAPVARATVLSRTAFLVAQLDLARAYGLVEEALRVLEPLGDDVDRGPSRQRPAAPRERGAGAGQGHRRGRDRARHAAHHRGRADVGARWRRRHRLRPGAPDDDLDRAIAMTERLIRDKAGPGGDDPFNYVMLSGPPGRFAGTGSRRGRTPRSVARATRAKEPTSSRHGGCVAWRWWPPTTAGPTRPAGSPARGSQLAIESGDLALQVYHRHILGFVALSLGDYRTADAELTMAATVAEASGTRHPGRFKVDGDRLEAAIGVGDLERARAIVGFLEHVARVAPTPWTLAIGARGRGLVDAAAGDLDAALASLERALVEHERLPMPFERGRTLLAKGQIHRRRKEKRLADQTLHEALAIFESLGAPLWADRTSAELARIGLRPQAPAELTATERRVAELAATGLSNRQIAEQAFLAPKTVGNVLGRVYEKLGIHSRAELGARMGEGIRRGGVGRQIGVIAPFVRPDTRPTVRLDGSPTRHDAAQQDVPRRTVLAGHRRAHGPDRPLEPRAGGTSDDPRRRAGRTRRVDPHAGRPGRVLAVRSGRRNRGPVGQRTRRAPSGPDRGRDRPSVRTTKGGGPMTSKYARLSIFVVALILGGCTTTGADTTTGPTQQPAATRAAPAASLQGGAPVPVASSTPEATESPEPSQGDVASDEPTAGPTARPIDPCSLLTSTEASDAIGVTLGAGKHQIVSPDTVCTYAKGVTEVKVFLTPPTDPVAARAYYESHKSEIPPQAHITELPTFYDGAVIARASLPIGTISGIYVLKGTNFFELYCALPACSDDALMSGAQLVAGRLH